MRDSQNVRCESMHDVLFSAEQNMTTVSVHAREPHSSQNPSTVESLAARGSSLCEHEGRSPSTENAMSHLMGQGFAAAPRGGQVSCRGRAEDGVPRVVCPVVARVCHE